MNAIGLVTIGQSPRPDAVRPMQEIWGCEFPVTERGALDELTEGEITALKPCGGEQALVTRLRDGRSVLLSHHRLEPRVRSAVQVLADGGCDPIIISCTGLFELGRNSVLVVQPRFILNGMVQALVPGAKLGILVPEDTQQETLGNLWKNKGFEVVTAVASPYDFGADPGDFSRAAARFTAEGTDLTVMDCMGYTEEMREFLRCRGDTPVLLASSAVAHAVASIL